MPKILTNEAAIAVRAKNADGSPIRRHHAPAETRPPEQRAPEPTAPAAPDGTDRIVSAIEALNEAIAVRVLSEEKPGAYAFRVVSRDSKGRVLEFTATEVTG